MKYTYLTAVAFRSFRSVGLVSIRMIPKVWSLFHLLFFLFHSLFYLFGRQDHREERRVSFDIRWFSPKWLQWAGPGQAAAEVGSFFLLSHVGAGTPVRGPSPTAFPGALASNWVRSGTTGASVGCQRNGAGFACYACVGHFVSISTDMQIRLVHIIYDFSFSEIKCWCNLTYWDFLI